MPIALKHPCLKLTLLQPKNEVRHVGQFTSGERKSYFIHVSLTISHIECVSIMFLSLSTNKDYKVDEKSQPKKKKIIINKKQQKGRRRKSEILHHKRKYDYKILLVISYSLKVIFFALTNLSYNHVFAKFLVYIVLVI